MASRIERPSGLTEREAQVVGLLAGPPTKQIAARSASPPRPPTATSRTRTRRSASRLAPRPRCSRWSTGCCMGRTPDRVEAGSFVASSAVDVGEEDAMSGEGVMSGVATGDRDQAGRSRPPSGNGPERHRRGGPDRLLVSFLATRTSAWAHRMRRGSGGMRRRTTFRSRVPASMVGVALRAPSLGVPRDAELPARRGEVRWSPRALPFVIVGGTLYSVPPGWSSPPWPRRRPGMTSWPRR